MARVRRLRARSSRSGASPLTRKSTHHVTILARRCTISARSHITERTRRLLTRSLADTAWYGELDEVEFLARLYDLDNLPGVGDPRYKTARQDLVQHCIRNPDYTGDWIFRDERFHLADSDSALLRFLAEMLHPAVCTDLAEVRRLHAFINETLAHDGYELIQTGSMSGAPIFTSRRIGAGVYGAVKTIFFASDGPKPQLVFPDALNMDPRAIKNTDSCLQYDRHVGEQGLTWADLCDWWAEREGLAGNGSYQISRSLYRRLDRSLGSNDAERRVLRTYAERYVQLGAQIPALLPQVYLYYDPYTRRQRTAEGAVSPTHQRMDFLLLLPHGERIVIECDGNQHYSDDKGRADPHRYAKMVAEDRELRLRGYEVYRIGGAELTSEATAGNWITRFFDRLAERHPS